MYYEKWDLFEKLFDQGIKPNNDKFESSVVELFKEKIVEEVDFKDVSPETWVVVSQKAHDFKSQMKEIWTNRRKVCTYFKIIILLFSFSKICHICYDEFFTL